MPITSLVLTLREDRPAGDALARLRRDVPELELGDPQGARLPAVLDADTYENHDRGLRQLRDHQDVSFVDVVFHDFSDVTDFNQRAPRRREQRP
jgi:hypothetical protein